MGFNPNTAQQYLPLLERRRRKKKRTGVKIQKSVKEKHQQNWNNLVVLTVQLTSVNTLKINCLHESENLLFEMF